MTRLCLAVLAALLIAAGDATAQTRSFGQTAGWSVIAESDGARFMGCGAMRDGSRGFLGLAQHQSGDWMLALGMPGIRGTPAVRLTVDGQALRTGGAKGDGMVVEVPLVAADLDRIAAGRTLAVQVDEAGAASWPIGGAAQAMALVRRCVTASGRR